VGRDRRDGRLPAVVADDLRQHAVERGRES
jgi:hypothetical protein